MVDFKRYHRLRQDGSCRIEKTDIGFVVLFKRCDPETGIELSPEPNYVTKEELLKEKESLEHQLDAVNSIISDIEKL